MTDAYSPPRDMVSKVGRRLTQWRTARQADLRFAEPILSITFDDFPASAARDGARILEAHGARGTYYAAAGLANTDGPSGRYFSPTDIARLTAKGHEIGCHTSDHADCAQRDVFDTLRDLAKNRDALAAMGAGAARSHAFPYGETTFHVKNNLPPRFASARGVAPGLNVGQTDLAQLRAYPMFGAPAMTRLRNALKRAARRKAWVIGFTHDIADAPTDYGTSAGDLDALLRLARGLGFLVLPVSTALERRLA